MTRRITLPDEAEAFRALFTGIQRSWFRVETLQQYNAASEREEFKEFLRGQPVDLTPGPWQDMVRKHVAAGRCLTRVHVIEEPHSDYIRYELAVYPVNTDAGEDVRVIPVRRGEWPTGVPQHDYWLLDDRDLWLMHYAEGGALQYVEQVVDPAQLAAHRRWRDAALSHSTPLADYTSALHQHAS